MRMIPIAIVLTLCLTSAAALAQTPAQDESIVAADRQSIEDAKAVVAADRVQQQADIQTGNQPAIQADTDKLIQDGESLTDARDKLKEDKKDLRSDKKTFDGDDDDK